MMNHKLWPWMLSGALACASMACTDEDESNNEIPDASVTPDDMGADMTPEPDSGPVPDMGADMGDMNEELSSFSQLRGEVKVWRDSDGIRHVYAEYLEDLFFLNGYLHARDRFIQLEFYRRYATGTLAEAVGAQNEGAIEVDGMMRTLGLKRAAEALWETQDKATESAIALTSYSSGINAYLAQWKRGEITPPAPATLILPARAIKEWTPADSLAVARLLAFNLTYDVDIELSYTDARQRMLTTFSDEAQTPQERDRAGFFHDFMRFAPPPTRGISTASPHRARRCARATHSRP